MRRREFLAGGAGLVGIGAAGRAASAREAAPVIRSKPAVYLVPGYRTDLAHYRGRAVEEAPDLRRALPADYRGPTTMVTRIDEADGSVRRALMPIRGHAIALRLGGGSAVWNSMEGDTVLVFDPASLEIGAIGGFAGEGMVGGGHAVFTPGGAEIVVTERRRREVYSGRPADHYGRVSIRDAATLRVIESYGAEGMAPHDIALMEDGKHVAIANYGSHLPKDAWRPEIVEPSLTILELASGRVVARLTPPQPMAELRHLAAAGFDRIAAVLVRRGSLEEESALLSDCAEVYEADSSTRDAGAYLPAPVIRFDGLDPRSATLSWPPDSLTARQAQSIVYDRKADEVLVTFTSSHAIGVFSGADGRAKQLIRTDRFGLRYPRGIALHPDGVHYAVSGSWRDIALVRRGAHEVDAGRSIAVVLFDHSHIAVV
jgi:DNA-binding beta-propeller fold protein YncE